MIRRKNVFHAVESAEFQTAHHGEGKIRVFRPYGLDNFSCKCRFVDYAVLPPGTSIGIHQHTADNEEIYFIVSGEGQMHMDGEDFPVQAGDVIVNRPLGSHGLMNSGAEDLHLFVIEISV